MAGAMDMRVREENLSSQVVMDDMVDRSWCLKVCLLDVTVYKR